MSTSTQIKDNHALIATAQIALNLLGHLAPGVVYIEGELDPSTEAALRSFQQRRGLSVTGLLDDRTQAALLRVGCNTQDRLSISPRFVANQGGWDKRDLTYAFTTMPGSSGATQTISDDDAKAAVRRAFATWEGAGVELRFAEVGRNDNPDIVVEWVPADHSQPGDWLVSDDSSLADIPDSAPLAHAGYPPAPGVEGRLQEPPLAIHFDDTEVVWNDSNTERVALHEIGHALGLEHSNSPPSVMVRSLTSLFDLQQDDLDGIESIYTKPGPERFNAIWAKPTVKRRAAWGLLGEELEPAAEQQRVDGYRTGRLNAYRLPNGEIRYNVVYDQVNHRRRWIFGHTRADFDTVAAEMAEQGRHFIDLNVFVLSNAEIRLNAVWTDEDTDTTTRLDLALADFELQYQQLKGQGYRSMTISTHVLADGTPRWSGLFWKDPVPSQVRLGLRREELETLVEELKTDDWSPIDINAYVLPNGQGERWNAVWEKRDSVSWEALWGWVRIDAERRTHNTELKGRAPWVLNTYVNPPAQLTTITNAIGSVNTDDLRGVVLGLACDEQRIYATHYIETKLSPHLSDDPGTLIVLDRATLQVIHPGIVVGYRPRNVAVNPVTNTIYVSNYDQRSYSLSIIDGVSLQVTATIPLGASPQDVAVNPLLNRVYVGGGLQPIIHVLDGSTGERLEPIQTGRGVNGMSVDPTTATLYYALSNRSVAPFVNALGSVIDDGETREILPLIQIEPLLSQTIDVAVDVKNDRIYAANLGGGGVKPSVTVLHRSSRQILATIGIGGPIRAIACNSDARQAYVATDSKVFIINTATNQVERDVTTGAGPYAIVAAQGSARQIFVGSRIDGSVVRLT
jgi:YVTN family beta-propeller protein